MSIIFDYILVILFHSSCIHGCLFVLFFSDEAVLSGGGGNNNTAKYCIDLFCLLIHYTHILMVYILINVGMFYNVSRVVESLYYDSKIIVGNIL